MGPSTAVRRTVSEGEALFLKTLLVGVVLVAGMALVRDGRVLARGLAATLEHRRCRAPLEDSVTPG